MRYAEYAMLLVPVAVVAAWFYGIRGLSLRGVAAFLALFAIVALLLFAFGTARVFNGKYVPAHLEGGRIVAGNPK